MEKTYKAVFALLLLMGSNVYATEETLESVTNRGVMHKFLLTQPNEPPKASVILLAGGHGKLSLGSFLGSPSIGWGAGNNLVRTRKDYAEKGLLVATLDAPENIEKMGAIWRMKPAHASDIGAVVNFLKDKADVPVWIIGTSRGSFSAANAGIQLKDKIAGIITTSSVTRSKKRWRIYDDYPNGIINMPLDEVTVPVLIVSHKDDGCVVTPASNIDQLAAQFTRSSKVKKVLVEGGDYPISDPCDGQSQHGFLGIEQQVVDLVAQFIQEN